VSARGARRAAAALAWSAAAAAAGAALGPRYGGELTVGVPDLPASLEPAAPQGAGARLLAGLVHEPLVRTTADGLPAPAVARGWSVAADGQEWTLQLSEAAVFHDGHPVRSEDAARCLRRFLRSSSPAAARLAGDLDGGEAYRSRAAEALPGVAAPDPRRLVLRFREPVALPLAPLAAPAAAMTGASGAGAGPFVPTVHTAGRVVLTAFGGHVRGRPFLDRITLRGGDPEALRSDLQSGAADLVAAGAAAAAGSAAEQAATLLLVLDPSRPPFDRAEARAAAAGAVNREDLVRYFLPGGDAGSSLLPPSVLAALGAAAPRPPAPVSGAGTMVVSREVPPVVSQRVLASLAAAGLRFTARPADAAEARAAAAPARLLLWCPEVPEAALALEELAQLVPPVAEAREALAAARLTRHVDRRRALLLKADAALRAAQTLIPLAAAPVAAQARRGVHGVGVDRAGRVVLEDAWVEP